MTTPTFPATPRPDAVSWALRGNTQVFRSPLSGSEQLLELPGARWVVELRFSDLRRSEAAALEAFLADLVGAAGTFYLWNHARETPQGVATGTPLVAGAGQTGKSLATDGWTASTTGILQTGDFFAVGGELKQVTADADSDAGGAATLAFTPPLRQSPADNAPLTVTKALGTFRLVSDDAARVRHSGALESITVSAIEQF